MVFFSNERDDHEQVPRRQIRTLSTWRREYAGSDADTERAVSGCPTARFSQARCALSERKLGHQNNPNIIPSTMNHTPAKKRKLLSCTEGVQGQ